MVLREERMPLGEVRAFSWHGGQAHRWLAGAGQLGSFRKPVWKAWGQWQLSLHGSFHVSAMFLEQLRNWKVEEAEKKLPGPRTALGMRMRVCLHFPRLRGPQTSSCSARSPWMQQQRWFSLSLPTGPSEDSLP